MTFDDRSRDESELPPQTDRVIEPSADADVEAAPVDEIPREALEEARRWDDVPMDEPEESTGVDV